MGEALCLTYIVLWARIICLLTVMQLRWGYQRP